MSGWRRERESREISARSAVCAGIEAGDPVIVMMHANEAGLSTSQVELFLAKAAVKMAERFERAAEVVGKSVNDVEGMKGDQEFELRRAFDLRQIASKLRFRSSEI